MIWRCLSLDFFCRWISFSIHPGLPLFCLLLCVLYLDDMWAPIVSFIFSAFRIPRRYFWSLFPHSSIPSQFICDWFHDFHPDLSRRSCCFLRLILIVLFHLSIFLCLCFAIGLLASSLRISRCNCACAWLEEALHGLASVDGELAAVEVLIDLERPGSHAWSVVLVRVPRPP